MTLNCSIPALGILTFPKKVLMLREITTPDAAPPLEDTSFRLAELLACYRGVGNTEENGDMEENVIEEEDADSNMEEEGFMDHVPILNMDDYAIFIVFYTTITYAVQMLSISIYSGYLDFY